MPAFLFQVLMEQQVSLLDVDGRMIDTTRTTTLDVDNIRVEVLLFQARYLTIMQEVVVNNRLKYTLGYPKLEVRESLNTAFLEYLDQPREAVEHLGQALVDLLQANNLEGFRERLSS